MDSKAVAIKELQQMLRDIAKTEPKAVSVIPDGVFAEETENAVKDFQRRNGLEETGIVNYEVWEKIRESHKKALFELSDPVQVIKIRKEDLPLFSGMKNPFVKQLNIMLIELANRHSNFEKPSDTDEFSKETENQVKNWQKVINHDITGVVDKLTWNRLAEYYLL